MKDFLLPAAEDPYTACRLAADRSSEIAVKVENLADSPSMYCRGMHNAWSLAKCRMLEAVPQYMLTQDTLLSEGLTPKAPMRLRMSTSKAPHMHWEYPTPDRDSSQHPDKERRMHPVVLTMALVQLELGFPTKQPVAREPFRVSVTAKDSGERSSSSISIA
ncbi:hypothetical protein DL98DRAFT_598237 [Cadophora sp. DSE1049]|nr:hypothetical protein DL98DRAFT_598237 [Cadophora sp. DSE1049]